MELSQTPPKKDIEGSEQLTCSLPPLLSHEEKGHSLEHQR
jgi:hypothetical protein